MTEAALQQRLGCIEAELIALNPLRICAALPELELLLRFVEAAPGSMEQIGRIHRLAVQASAIYGGWISVAASFACGYDAAGMPAIPSDGVLRTEG